ncbi:unnamed protein product [Mytilus coruscus]|uniref:Uncharacterized protein n=1 Tax=Mytilus coruscus TaxID=42192 RepID=A0A6J8D8J3_MYTCO|nr:unnamed protein product [Mytilus coruscus]
MFRCETEETVVNLRCFHHLKKSAVKILSMAGNSLRCLTIQTNGPSRYSIFFNSHLKKSAVKILGTILNKMRNNLYIKCVILLFTVLLLFQISLKVRKSVGKQVVYDRDTEYQPLFVIGILTSDYTADRRAAQRKTWISTMVQYADKLPFRIAYKFVFDRPSNASIHENYIYDDIVYLNVTHHGWAVKFGEKLFEWLKYVHTNYPDALIAAKMDDDVFLCIPQLTARLYELLSPKLYYGWRRTTSNSPEIDEMFVVLGMDLIKRIVERKYCGESECNNHNELVDRNFAHEALYIWLSIYNDVDTHADDKRIVMVWRRKDREHVFAKHINIDSCVDNVLLHKALPLEMFKLHEQTSPAKFPQVIGPTNYTEAKDSHKTTVYDFNSTLAGAVTGSLFSGNVIRGIPVVPLKNYWSMAPNQKEKVCDNWAVVTTIYPPSKAVQYIDKLRNWCLLVVADIKTPTKNIYLKHLSNQNTKYLTIVEQKQRYPMLAEAIPFNHFGRKNIGYIYAIQHKAKMIWDFDDDNIGIVDTIKFNSTSTATNYAEVCTKYVTKIVNPYPYFGVNETYSWPRGFPLQFIKDNRTIPKECNLSRQKQVGIMQALANEQPDVDAIYRLTRKTPFNFSNNIKRALLIPRHSYTPFNAQATLWFSSSFHLMPLPVSVNGRVSDIWRSYIAQFFLHKKNTYLAFLPPCVFQERNPHTILKDFNAEMDLYEKSNQLIEFLSSFDAKNLNTTREVYEQLYVRNYIDISDLLFIQAWEKTLSSFQNRKL